MPDPAPHLQGDGFVLRPWRSSDLDALLAHANDEAVSRGLRDRFPYPYTRADGEAFLGGRVLALDGPLRAIEVDGAAVGGIGATLGTDVRRHTAELGYWLGRAVWGQGLMRRVVATYVPWLMQQHQLYRVQAEVLDFNAASARVLLASGFTEEGVARSAVFKRGQLHDLRLFALVRTTLD